MHQRVTIPLMGAVGCHSPMPWGAVLHTILTRQHCGNKASCVLGILGEPPSVLGHNWSSTQGSSSKAFSALPMVRMSGARLLHSSVAIFMHPFSTRGQRRTNHYSVASIHSFILCGHRSAMLLKHWRNPSQAQLQLKIAMSWLQKLSGIGTPLPNNSACQQW